MAEERIFLDHASGGPLLPAARVEMERVLSGEGAAPGGGHREAREARVILEAARKQSAEFLGTEEPDRLVFTSGGTEAVQAAIRGWGEAAGKGTIYVSEIEHPAVETAVRRLQKSGFSVVPIPVDGEGRLQWKKVKPAGPGLVCVHVAHHDLGTMQDLVQARVLANSVKAQLFLDGTFGAGWIDLPRELEGVDLLAVSGHRLGAPKGSGLLWVRSGTAWKAQLEGGRQENDQRAGTENLPAIAGLGAALQEWNRDAGKFRKCARESQEVLWREIRKKVSSAKLHGPEPGPERSPAHLGLSFAGLEAESLALVLDRVGVVARGGSGCVTREMRIPPGMRAIGATPEEARSLILFTLGRETRASQMALAAQRVADAVLRLSDAFAM